VGGKQVFAVLVHGPSTSWASLKVLLKSLSVETWTVQSCEEAARLANQTEPELIFTDTLLPDGTWRDVIAFADSANAPINVIVVGESADTKRHASESGAFDLIIPPINAASLTEILRNAVDDVRRRRQKLAGNAVG
jgi:DNA-binding NtrC family response regulator